MLALWMGPVGVEVPFQVLLGEKPINVFARQRPDKENLMTNDFEPKPVSAYSNSVKVFVTLKFR
jgi:hypothetical protein